MSIYLAVNNGACEGWSLTEYETGIDALAAVQKGETHSNEWKILKELQITIKGEGDNERT